MRTIQSIVHQYATGKNIIVLFLLTQTLYFVMIAYTIPQVTKHTNNMDIFDMRPQGYSVTYAQELLDSLGDSGRTVYLTRQLPLDFIYPALFMATYTLLLSYVFKRAFATDSFVHVFVFVPILAGIFDYLENIAVIVMLTMYPDFSRTMALVSSAFSIIKSGLTSAFFLLLFVGLAKWLVEYRRSQQAANTSLQQQ